MLEFLEAFKVAQPGIYTDRDLLLAIARTSLRTKLAEEVIRQAFIIVLVPILLCVSVEEMRAFMCFPPVPAHQAGRGGKTAFSQCVRLRVLCARKCKAQKLFIQQPLIPCHFPLLTHKPAAHQNTDHPPTRPTLFAKIKPAGRQEH